MEITPIPTPVDLSNLTTCVPADQFIQLMPMLVLKTDAIRLGLLCFIAGIIFMVIINEIDKRWKK
jgi:hypothetical protein